MAMLDEAAADLRQTMAALHRELDQRIAERDEALAQQAATGEILSVISRSPADVRPVFEAIVARAAALCEAEFSAVARLKDGLLHLVAVHSMSPEETGAFHSLFPRPPARNFVMGLAFADAQPVHFEDVLTWLDYDTHTLQVLQSVAKYRSFLAVPIFREGKPIGVIGCGRREVRHFTPTQIELVKTFADQAAIAIENGRLFGELETRNRDLSEALEQQTATAEVLQVINASPGKLTPVFDAMLEKAMRLCEAAFGILLVRDGGHFQTAALHGVPPALAELLSSTPREPGKHTAVGRMLDGEDFVHFEDMTKEPAYQSGDPRQRAFVELGGTRTYVAVPLRKDGRLVGTIGAYRQELRPFTDKQIALLQNFAAQAVIAMENARLLTETREALEQQTATAEVLGVINSSPGDLAPVFDAILEKAHTLCDAPLGSLVLYDGEHLRAVATRGYPEAYEALARQGFPSSSFLPFERLLRGELVHFPDATALTAVSPITRTAIEIAGIRTVLLVPLRKESALLGYISAQRQEVRPFSDKQIALLQNFAAQAVIAMENARLINETREALQQQTATAEVLQVINRSPGDLAPVFEAILDKAHTLCGATLGSLFLFDGELFRAAAVHGYPEDLAQRLREGVILSATAQLLNESVRWVHNPDLTRIDAPTARAVSGRGGVRTNLMLPLRKDGKLLGAISCNRQEVRPFSDKEIALLQNFAAQAVIAMDNARLLIETREALEQQTATAEVLQVINASPGDLAPVFDSMLDKATRLSEAAFGILWTYDSERFQAVAFHNVPPAYVEFLREPQLASPVAPLGRVERGEVFAHVPDLAAEEYHERAGLLVRQGLSLGGFRTVLAVPMRKDTSLLGAITIYRQEVLPFSDKQIALLQNFAAQAVIAIENARLLNELHDRTRDLQESLEYQTATSDVLKVISRSTFDLGAALSTVVTAAARLCRADHAGVYRNEGGEYRWAAGYNQSPEYESVERAVRILPAPGTLVGRTAVKGGPVQILDAEADPLYEAKEDARIGNIHSMLGVPLLREGSPIGVIGLARTRIEPFTGKQVELVSTFADQSVIAIENARLLNELQARTDELTRSVAELQTLEEVLRAVNSSLDLDTVLATIISRAAQLSQADEGTIYEFDETEEVFVPKSAFGMSVERVEALRERKVRLGETHLGRAAVQRAPVHVEDVQQDSTLRDPDRGGLLKGIHAVLAVPLLRDDKVVGGLVIRRRTVGGFAPTIPTLLQTFAGQAVLAIENARLFQELGRRGEEARRAHAAAEAALADLRRAQDRLIQAEKMASLGQLTAGIAHEIKNPLNFVNNFAGLSVELLEELKETAAPAIAGLAEDERADVDEIVGMLTGNLEKIAEHGRRADGIVKSMLEHSRGGSGERREVDLNSLVEEALNLAYHGARAQDQNFNITLERDLDHALAPIELVPQDITRVFLNLFGNGFYAAAKRQRDGAAPDFRPVLKVATRDLGDAAEIRIRDNGAGIRAGIRDKLFQPFFTTKPTGEGTGLGLSISWDIVTQQHGGTIAVDSQIGEFTEFTIRLPRARQVTTSEAAG